MMAPRAGVENLDAYVESARLRMGVIGIFAGLLAALVLRRLGAGMPARLAVAPLFFVGAYGVTAGLLRTCSITALRGKRCTRCGTEPIVDRAELAPLRRRARTALALSMLVAAAASALLAMAR
jgi:hypothetical protein